VSIGTVFIDTAAFIAMTVETDALHAPAMRIMEEIAGTRVPTVTSDLVLVELLNGSSNTARRAVAASFVRGVLENPSITVVPM
jgi:predicted nucleic acid-binding protein